MKKVLLLACLFAFFVVSGCSHQMHITNAEDYFSPPSPPLAKPIKLGITSSSVTDFKTGRYVNAIVDALQRSGNFERVLYPYSLTVNQGQADMLIDIAVKSKYDGSGANFFITWPGFLIFAPAAWGYKYNAEIETQVNITDLKSNASKQFAIPTQYIFRHADMGRTALAEVGGWFFWSVPALIGGVFHTGYDDGITPEFITAVSPNYGAYVSRKIVDALASAPTATTTSLR